MRGSFEDGDASKSRCNEKCLPIETRFNNFLVVPEVTRLHVPRQRSTSCMTSTTVFHCRKVDLGHEGECTPQCACPSTYTPVCGRDNVTYSNECELRCQCVSTIVCLRVCVCVCVVGGGGVGVGVGITLRE